MPSNSGKWVSRAAQTGGGRTYRGQVPANWYVALLLIVLVGIGSVVYARSEYRSAAAADTTPPTKSTTWYAAFDFDVCGTQREPVAANETDTTTQSFYTTGNGVIVIAPKTTTDAGTSAVLGKFVSGYTGMALSATALTVPTSALSRTSATKDTTTTTTAPATTTTAPATTTTTTGANTSAAVSGHPDIVTTAKTSKTTTANATTTTKAKATTKKSKTSDTKASTTTTTTKPISTTTFTNGETCPHGTKDAGKAGQVMVTYWSNAFASKEAPTTVTGNPATLRFTNNQEITIGFVPAGTKLPKPTGTVVEALLQASTGAQVSTTPTTTASAATTTVPATTATTTTAPATTSTTSAASTTSKK